MRKHSALPQMILTAAVSSAALLLTACGSVGENQGSPEGTLAASMLAVPSISQQQSVARLPDAGTRRSGWLPTVVQQSKVPIVYLADWLTGIFIYAQESRHGVHKGLGELQVEGANGLFVDNLHNLWVAKYSGVYVYARGQKSPSETLTAPEGAWDVAVDDSGTAYASDTAQTPDQIYVYTKGSTYPTSTITDPNITSSDLPAELTVDNEGNLYLGYGANNYTSGAIDLVKSGSQTPTTILQFSSRQGKLRWIPAATWSFHFKVTRSPKKALVA